MRAVILAAGEGVRLRPYSADRPKCLVELGGSTLLGHQLATLERVGIREVHIVTGYRAEQIERLGYPTFHNHDFARTNMVASLMCAAEVLDGQDDVLVAYGDIVYEPRVLEALCRDAAPLATTVDELWLRLWKLRNDDPIADAETLRIDASSQILELGKRPSSLDEIEAQYMGLIKVGADFSVELVRAYRSLDPKSLYDGRDLPNMYMTSFLQHLIDSGRPLRAVRIRGGWLEIDTASDLETYARMLKEDRLDDYCRLPLGDAAARAG
jgi:choline kinase